MAQLLPLSLPPSPFSLFSVPPSLPSLPFLSLLFPFLPFPFSLSESLSAGAEEAQAATGVQISECPGLGVLWLGACRRRVSGRWQSWPEQGRALTSQWAALQCLCSLSLPGPGNAAHAVMLHSAGAQHMHTLVVPWLTEDLPCGSRSGTLGHCSGQIRKSFLTAASVEVRHPSPEACKQSQTTSGMEARGRASASG